MIVVRKRDMAGPCLSHENDFELELENKFQI
jgi:hypothetical protein